MHVSCRLTRHADPSALSRATVGRIRRSLRVFVVTVAVLFGALAPAQVAAASVGSVPPEVTKYVTDGSLVERLNDLYGLDASGDGIDFDETTKPGPISRVWTWTDERLAGEPTEHPVQLTNNWVVPIVIAEAPVGVATIWINPETGTPELAWFDPEPEWATALAAVPDAAQLVRDDGSAAWFALQDGVLTPLVTGSSGVETPAPVAEVALVPPSGEQPAPPSEPNTGLGLALGVILLLVVVIGVALYVASRRGRTRDPAPTDEDPAQPEDEESSADDDLSSPAP
jgi:hypothetical protein